jgi:hypothetical protein
VHLRLLNSLFSFRFSVFVDFSLCEWGKGDAITYPRVFITFQ